MENIKNIKLIKDLAGLDYELLDILILLQITHSEYMEIYYPYIKDEYPNLC